MTADTKDQDDAMREAVRNAIEAQRAGQGVKTSAAVPNERSTPTVSTPARVATAKKPKKSKKKSGGRGPKPDERRTTIDWPKEMLRQLKIQAAFEERPVRAIVLEAVRRYLGGIGRMRRK